MFQLAKFAADCRGNIAVIFALVTVPLAIAAGVAIDYNRIITSKLGVQAALDSAVLAAGTKSTFDIDFASKFFTANRPETSDLTVSSLAFTSEGNGVVAGKAEVIIPLGLMGVAGLSNQKISVTSRAKTKDAMKISQTEFQITNAQGAYDKEIYLFTKDKDGKVTSETLVMTYDYTYTTSGGTKVFGPSMKAAKTVPVGPYETVGQKMVVYEDTTYRGRKVNPKSYFSDDKLAAKWTRIKGECTDPAGQINSWEDGGDANFMDFVFTLKCTTTSSGSKSVRLIN